MVPSRIRPACTDMMAALVSDSISASGFRVPLGEKRKRVEIILLFLFLVSISISASGFRVPLGEKEIEREKESGDNFALGEKRKQSGHVARCEGGPSAVFT